MAAVILLSMCTKYRRIGWLFRLSDYVMVEKMIDAGYCIDSKDKSGNTILHLMFYEYTGTRPSDSHILNKLLNAGYSFYPNTVPIQIY